jgi:hypothetical protein
MFTVLQEGKDLCSCDLFHNEFGDWPLPPLRHESKEKAPCITIRHDGVGRDVALSYHPVVKEAMQ